MAGYFRQDLPNVPNYRNMDFGASDMIKAGEVVAQSLGKVREQELMDAKRAEDQRRYETELGFKQRNEQRVMDELNRAQATREGVLATLDPKAYQGAKISDMENAMRAGLANLSPQDRAEAERQWAAHFNRGATGEYVNKLATTNANVDPSALLSAQVSMQNKALNDPTSELYKAKQQAEWDADKKKMDYQSQKTRGDAQFRYNLETKAAEKKENELINAQAKILMNDPLLVDQHDMKILTDPNATFAEKKAAVSSLTNKKGDVKKKAEEIAAMNAEIDSLIKTYNQVETTPSYKVLIDPKSTDAEKKAALMQAKSFIQKSTELAEEKLKDTKEREKEDYKKNKENEMRVINTASYTANPKEFAKMYEEYKAVLGDQGTAESFMRAIPNVRWSDPKTSTDGVWTDIGLVDVDWSNVEDILRQVKEAKSKGVNDSKKIKEIIDAPIPQKPYYYYPSGLYGITR